MMVFKNLNWCAVSLFITAKSKIIEPAFRTNRPCGGRSNASMVVLAAVVVWRQLRNTSKEDSVHTRTGICAGNYNFVNGTEIAVTLSSPPHLEVY